MTEIVSIDSRGMLVVLPVHAVLVAPSSGEEQLNLSFLYNVLHATTYNVL